jgi:hypothetical protein
MSICCVLGQSEILTYHTGTLRFSSFPAALQLAHFEQSEEG